jgi:hypothetical protein
LETAASEALDFAKGGIDTYKLRNDIEKKMRDKKVRDGFEKYAEDAFKELVIKKQMYAGTDNKGRPKYKDYTLDNVVRNMIKDLRGGEGYDYGAGNIRAGIAKKLSSIAAVKKQRGKIVSNKEFEKIKDESNDKYFELLETIKPKYKFQQDSFRYTDDASQVIFQYAMGRGKMSEAFEDGIREDVDAFLEYLSDLPTEYFEGKAQRAMQLSEFKAAVVPSDVKPETIQALKDAGLEIITYDGNLGEAERDEDRKKSVIEAGEKTFTLFQAQRNAIGLFSAVEQAVLDMELPQWKDGDKPANAVEILAKLKKTKGVKKEELDQLDIETYLQTKDKFTRGEVAQFIRDNGAVLKEIIKGGKKNDDSNTELDWGDREVQDDSENWQNDFETYMEEFENESNIADYTSWMADWSEKNIDTVFEHYASELTDKQKDEIQAIFDSDDKKYARSVLDKISQYGFDFPKDLKEEAREDYEEVARELAREAYFDNPVYVWAEANTNMYIVGNDEGYSIFD